MSAPDLFNNVLEVLAIAIRKKRKEAGKERKQGKKRRIGEREREREDKLEGKKKVQQNFYSLFSHSQHQSIVLISSFYCVSI